MSKDKFPSIVLCQNESYTVSCLLSFIYILPHSDIPQFYLVHIQSCGVIRPIKQNDPHMLTAVCVAVSHYIPRLCMWQLLGSGVDIGGGRGLLIEPSKLTTMKH